MKSIGTVVYLNEGNKKVMILNRGPIMEKNGKQYLFDYSGCVYPIGLVPEQILYFNEENIDKVVFEGYSDEEETRFQELYNNWIAGNSEKICKGNVSDLME